MQWWGIIRRLFMFGYGRGAEGSHVVFDRARSDIPTNCPLENIARRRIRVRKRMFGMRYGWCLLIALTLTALTGGGRPAGSGTVATGLPDLTIDAARLQASAIVKTRVFKSTDCANVEG